MLTEADYQKIIKAQERALKLAANPEYREQAMRAHGLASLALMRWDMQQLETLKGK